MCRRPVLAGNAEARRVVCLMKGLMPVLDSCCVWWGGSWVSLSCASTVGFLQSVSDPISVDASKKLIQCDYIADDS